MIFLQKLTAALFLSGLMTIAGLAPIATAQTQSPTTTSDKAAALESSDHGWHVDALPYLWFPAIHGTVGVGDQQASVDATAVDILSNFDFGLMGAAEIRYNRVIMPIDFMWVKLTIPKAIPIENAMMESVHVKITEDLFTPKIGYRVVSKPKFKADALFGIRYWHLGVTVNGTYGSVNWVDGLGGGRFQVMLTPKVILTISGDAGGGGTGTRLDYEVVGLLGYKLKKVTLQGGWRYLVIAKEHTAGPTGAFVDLRMPGVVFGAIIPLK